MPRRNRRGHVSARSSVLGDDMKRVLFVVVALTLGMNGIFFLLPLPPWEKVLISGIYGGLIGWTSLKLG